VKKKVIILLHAFHTISPGSVGDILEYAKEALSDPEPSVMGASLSLFHDLAAEQERLPQLKELVPSFVFVLKQIKDHKLPKDYDYHRLPAPWIQIKLLKLLAILGRDDRVYVHIISFTIY
jgi:AP-4 complex subunit epsilon-1